MDLDELRRAHGRVGYALTDDGIETVSVYVAPELRLGDCPECGGRLRYIGRLTRADGEPIEPMTVAQCESCGVGLLSEDD